MGRAGQIGAGLLVSGLLCLACDARTETPARLEADLLNDISRIKAIDNHAHPYKAVAAGEKPDDEFDALPLEGLEPFVLPERLRPDNPEFATASRILFGAASKRSVMQQRGDAYPSWVLDQLGIDTMFANRVAMGRGLTPPRFRWVSFVDALMLPLNNDSAKRSNKDYAVFYPGEERLLKRYLGEAGVATLPPMLDEYLVRVVNPTLERHKREGAVAVKFEIAYLRTLDFDTASHDDAARVYSRYASGSEPPATDYKLLQDYLFHEIALKAGSLGLPVHIHVADGAGPNYRQDGSNPLLLTTVLNDASLRKTNFVILHAGFPFAPQVASLLSKVNVYADFSFAGLDLYPRALSNILRSWIEAYPQKVLFGTDATPLSADIAWEETGWMGVTTARKALAIALAGMLVDEEISPARAHELASMVLRGNAMKLYGLH